MVAGLQEPLEFLVTASQSQVCLGAKEITIERCVVNKDSIPIALDKDGIKSWSYSRLINGSGASGGVITSASHAKPRLVLLEPGERYCFEPVRLKLKDDFRYTIGYTLYGERGALSASCNFSITVERLGDTRYA